MAYKIYTVTNYADTFRDPDDIHIKEFGYKDKLDDALLIAEKYIKDHFFHKDTKLFKLRNSNDYQATDFCSYGATIHVEEIIID